MAKLSSIEASSVYSCCGKYYAVTKAANNDKILCNYCKKQLIAPLRTPKIIVVDKR